MRASVWIATYAYRFGEVHGEGDRARHDHDSHALFSACSASTIINTGGNTKCKDFTAQDEKKQDDEVSKMLKDKSSSDPNNMEISATRLSPRTCFTSTGSRLRHRFSTNLTSHGSAPNFW